LYFYVHLGDKKVVGVFVRFFRAPLQIKGPKSMPRTWSGSSKMQSEVDAVSLTLVIQANLQFLIRVV
jgi:hypothetical protein